MRRSIVWSLALLLMAALPVNGQREPVLKQIDLPHPYYYREMYLPQLTSGPSSVTWSPDSESVVYSMQGCLWRQRLDSKVAEQLTAGPGYDYQPDWSPDGRWIVYASYHNDAIELHLLELATGKTRQITNGGAVNVEPRWSPDGKRIAFVSTAYHSRFHIFVAQTENGDVRSIERLTGETRSPLPRYYYSAFDHEISPTWSPDGTELIFISNRGHIHGTGGFWRMKAQPGAEAREVHYEETTWKARPDWSPDGTRVAYSSYLGRQWHQLWVIPAAGGDVFPLSYGDFDVTTARWSRDGRRIAFVSNRDGNTSLCVQDALGGQQRQLVAAERRYLKSMGRLRITVLDPVGRPTPARVFVTGANGRAYAPDDVWMHADDSFDRSERRFEAHYFHLRRTAEVVVPAGRVAVVAMKGLEHEVARAEIEVRPAERAAVMLRLRRLAMPGDAQGRWASGDLHVHMNYGGSYRNSPKNLVAQAVAENLQVVHNLIVNKEQRIPDIAYFTGKLDRTSTPATLLLHGQEFHTSLWGHLGLLNLTRNFLLPDYAGYPNTAAASPYPPNAFVEDLAHAQEALVGYVHPFETEPDPARDARLTYELPVDVALGKVDYLEVMGFSDHRSTAAVWYRLLNCGFRLPAGAGTDAMMNFASLRGPVGLNRVYVQVPPGPLRMDVWLNGLRKGRTFTTNGPLVSFTLGGESIGGELKLPTGQHRVRFTASLRSLVPVGHLEIVCNGQVVKELPLVGNRRSTNAQGTIEIEKSGWCLLRAWNEKSAFPILDLYPYATTSPIYVTVNGAPAGSRADDAYFLSWIERLRQAAEASSAWNSPAEKAEVLKVFSEAAARFQQAK